MSDQRQNEIREKAYEHYERRGRTDGFELEDWLNAEREVSEGRFAETVRRPDRGRTG